MKTVQSVFAGLCAILTLALLLVVAYLTFVFPKTIAIWVDEGRTISALEKLIVTASGICSSFGIVLMPLLILCFLASMLWLIVTVKRDKANQPEVATP